jgi:hypothetical protein
MIRRSAQLLLAFTIFLAATGVASAQISTTGTLIGTVTDPTGAVVAGADVRVRDDATGRVIETKSNQEGKFVVGNLNPGNYTVTIVLQGFKTAEYRAVKIVVGGIYDLAAKLEVGDVQSTITVEAGAEVLETTSTVVGMTIAGRAITQLPYTSRSALDLAILMPGAQTVGRPRETSFLGLPKGAINITYDGINVQDNFLKSSDGFFTRIRPQIDTVEEFSISTAGQSAEQAGEGAVQIRFETKRGGNDYKGGLWWYHRNDFFNSNYYFSNLAGEPRQRMRLNQFGYKLGGPVPFLRDRVFFFHAFDFYRKPESRFRERTILGEEAVQGMFVYGVTALPTIPAANTWTTCTASHPKNNNGPACTVNLLAMVAARGSTITRGFTTALDPAATALLNAIDAVRTSGKARLTTRTNPWTDRIAFNNPGAGPRNFPDLRLDWNISKNLVWTGIYHYQSFNSNPDFLNNRDPIYPHAPFDQSHGSQLSKRHQWNTALRWSLGTNKSNEVRVGVSRGQTEFAPDLNLSLYPQINTNLGSIRIQPDIQIAADPFHTFSPSLRHTPLAQLIDNFSWTRGKHNFAFGGSWTEIRFFQTLFSRAVNTVTLGMATSDPDSPIFSSANMPGSNSTSQGAARSIYAMLTGRVSGYSGTISVDEKQREYVFGAPLRRRLTQTEFGFYGSDNWRFRPTLTVNYGLRWEYQGAPKDPKNISYRPVGGVAGVFGVSGTNNLFKPGTLPGSITEFELNGDAEWYNKDLNNFAPSLGLAWQPMFENPLWTRIFGGPAKSVFRAGYSITFTREGINNFTSIVFANPGADGSIFANPVAPATTSTCATATAGSGSFPAGCLTYSQVLAGGLQTLQASPSSFLPRFQITPFAGQSVNYFDPELGIPYVQSWSAGIQREITPSTVFEVRYVGNHGTSLWRQFNFNERNIFENGFLQEFLNAQSNLAICRANQVACRTAGGSTSTTFESFANLGLPGQVPLPIISAAFNGTTSQALTTSGQRNSNFTSGARITQLDFNAAGGLASTLALTQTFACNMFGTAALPGVTCPSTAPVVGTLPVNFFIVNPHATGGPFLMMNGSHSTYHGLQLEVRRRPAKGLMFNGNYTWSKSLSNLYADSAVNALNFTTLRNPGYDKGPSPWDTRHALKVQAIWELPFGPGRRWSSARSWMNRIIEGWEFNSITRWQTGRVFNLTSGQGGTVTQQDSGIELAGLSIRRLQEMLSIRKLPNGQVFWFPDSLVNSSTGTANLDLLRPCSTPGKLCQQVFLYGPGFFRADWSITKRTRVTERVNIEYRAEFLNAFNHINFFYPGGETTTASAVSITDSAFGRVTGAYRDNSTTDDPGGRIIQMVLRVNF